MDVSMAIVISRRVPLKTLKANGARTFIFITQSPRRFDHTHNCVPTNNEEKPFRTSLFRRFFKDAL